MKIIDAKVRLRTEQLLKAWTTELKPYFREYIKLYKMSSRLSVIPVDELLEFAGRFGVEKMVVCGSDIDDNSHIIDIAQKYEEIIPVACVNVEDGIRYALREVDKCFSEGSVAVYIAPYKSKLNVNDRSLYPVYGLCELMKRPLIIHGAIHFWSSSYMWHGEPRYIDEIAVDFPELKIIVSHGGNGFGPPILAVAQRHPNVYLEFSALNPNYMAPEFLYAANTYLKDKCIFGTDYPLLDFEKAIERWKKVLKENVWEYFFHDNVLDALYKEPKIL